MKAFITGASGFVGLHLSKWLAYNNVEVYGASKSPQPHSTEMNWLQMDIMDRDSIEKCIFAIKPDYIIHLAAQSNVKNSWDDPVATIQTNVIGTLNLLEAVRLKNPKSLVLTVGSSEEYGEVLDAQNIHEDTKTNPRNPYGLSKYTVSQLTQQFSKAYEMRIIHVRPFNHIGPGQSLGFVVPDFAYQIVSIEREKTSLLHVGNLSAIRDFTDVRDIVKAYWKLLQAGIAGSIYNVCSGTGTKIEDILHGLIEQSEFDINIQPDPSKFRPVDVPVYVGSREKISSEVEWSPQIPLNKTLSDIMDYWRNRFER